MQVFELHFNPKNKENKIIDSFVYEAENVYEKRMGNLYMAGELNKALPQSARFLNNLASVIKKEYYTAGLKKSCQQSLQDALKKANEFLDAEMKKGNVSWLGNLNFSVLSLKDFVLNFTKIGDIKTLLIRNGELSDIGQTLESPETETSPLKIFSNIVNGKLAQSDKIIVLNKEVFSALTQNKDFLNQFSQIFNEKDLKEILKKQKQVLSEISGVCLLLIVSEELTAKETLTFHQKLPKFSFHKTFIKPLYKLKPKIKLPSWKLPKLKTPQMRLPKISFAKPKFPKIKFAFPKRNLILLLLLILVLAAFFFIFKGEKERELNEARQMIEEAQSKILMAENFLILEEENKAQALFQEAWDIIYPLTKAGSPLKNEAVSLKKSLEEHLKQ